MLKRKAIKQKVVKEMTIKLSKDAQQYIKYNKFLADIKKIMAAERKHDPKEATKEFGRIMVTNAAAKTKE